MTAIILLNWNGAEDTLDCLQSLTSVPDDYFCIVADNGSEDDSALRIEQFLGQQGIRHTVLKRGETLKERPVNHEVILYQIGENLGFAKGNNEAIRLISSVQPDYYLLLNNDTIVEPNFLHGMLEFAAAHPHVEAVTPLICYNDNRNLVWNAGGKQFFGFRKYFYAKQPVQSIKEKGHINVTFLTGCALFFSPQLLRKDGGLLTERFFFGEEDFEFCLQMNKQKKQMACVLTSKIYHKVSSSVANHDTTGKIYIYYLNRFVDMRLNHSPLFYALWSHVYSIYIIMLLHHKHYPFGQCFSFIKKLLKEASQKNGVSRHDFLEAIKA